MNSLKKLLSYGNLKLPKTTAIFNMGSASECISEKLNLCKVAKICYAKKAERLYKNALPYRSRQSAFWRYTNANEFTDLFLDSIKNKWKYKIDMLRVSEAGDFDSQKDVNTWEAIATNLKQNDIVTYVYTARKDLDYSQCSNLIVNGSDFKTAGVKHSFTAVKQFSTDKKVAKCLADCSVCHLCATNTNLDIEVLMH